VNTAKHNREPYILAWDPAFWPHRIFCLLRLPSIKRHSVRLVLGSGYIPYSYSRIVALHFCSFSSCFLPSAMYFLCNCHASSRCHPPHGAHFLIRLSPALCTYRIFPSAILCFLCNCHASSRCRPPHGAHFLIRLSPAQVSLYLPTIL